MARISKRSLVREHARYTSLMPEAPIGPFCSRIDSETAAVAATRIKIESPRMARLASG